ncbi:hypothetical protein ACP4OV_018231 [Aristida adscensionis]
MGGPAVSHSSTVSASGWWAPSPLTLMDGSDLPAAGDRPPEAAADGGGAGGPAAPPRPPERCDALAAAIAGVLGGALREHEARAAATARSQGEVAAAIDRLNGGTRQATRERTLPGNNAARSKDFIHPQKNFSTQHASEDHTKTDRQHGQNHFCWCNK